MECNHKIMKIGSDIIKQSDHEVLIREKAVDLARQYNLYEKQKAGYPGTMDKFNFCPDCGEKIITDDLFKRTHDLFYQHLSNRLKY